MNGRYSADKRFVMRYQWHSAIEEFHFVSASPAIKTTFIEFPPFRYGPPLCYGWSSSTAVDWPVNSPCAASQTARVTHRYNGKVLLSSDRAFSWRVKGNKVPPPVVLSLQILYYQQNAKQK